MLGFLRRHCTKDLPLRDFFFLRDITKSLFIALVRSHLVCRSQKEIKQIEAIVQRRITMLISTQRTFHTEIAVFVFISFHLEYLDLVFLYKCKANDTCIDLDNYTNFCSGDIQRGTTGRTVSQAKVDPTNINIQKLF